MKKICKKAIAFTLAMVMVLTTVLLLPQNTAEVQAASKKVYINPYSSKVVTYKPGDGVSNYTTVISIMGCTKASEIKNLKSSSSAVKVSAQNGYIRAAYKNKAAKATISCTVKGVKLKTTLTVKKYSNPLSAMKLGKTTFTSKFNKTDVYRQSKSFKGQTLTLKAKSGWKITKVSVYNNGSYKNYNVNSTKFSKKITLSGAYSSVYIYCTNSKTGVSECLTLRKQ